MIKVGILGLARREGTFAEVGLRSWEESGGAAVERALMAVSEGIYTIHRPLVIRSDRAELERILCDWCDAPHVESRCDLILTIGGIGMHPDEIMPEVTNVAIERAVPGIAELLRRTSAATPALEAVTSRGSAGIRRQTLIINLPGSEEGITSAMETLLPLLPALIQAVKTHSV